VQSNAHLGDKNYYIISDIFVNIRLAIINGCADGLLPENWTIQNERILLRCKGPGKAARFMNIAKANIFKK